MTRAGGGSNFRSHIAQVMNSHPLLRTSILLCHLSDFFFEFVNLIEFNLIAHLLPLLISFLHCTVPCV